MHPDAAAIRARVLAGIAGDRVPGFSFTGHFLALEWPRFGDDSVTTRLPLGPHCREPDGRVSLIAMMVALDTGLATAPRLKISPGVRVATACIEAQFTGHIARGDVLVDAHYRGGTQGAALPQLLSGAILRSGGAVICHASGAFVQVAPPAGAVMAPLPWQARMRESPSDDRLDAREQAVLAACDAALADDGAGVAFSRRFWSAPAEPGDDGAVCRIKVGPHMANRVGHVQGGILMGIAAETAQAAVPAHATLSSLSAWFISPGRSTELHCRSTVIHAGRSLAVVRTEITGAQGERILAGMSQHAASAP